MPKAWRVKNAMEKIESLKAEADKLKTAIVGVNQAAEESAKAMRGFVESCSSIEVDL